MIEETRIGKIASYYGGLYVKKENGKHYWCLDDYSKWYWEEIPKYLYDTLIKYQKEVE